MIDLEGIHPEQGTAVIVQNVALEPLDTGGRELAGHPANQLVAYLAYQRADFMGMPGMLIGRNTERNARQREAPRPRAAETSRLSMPRIVA